MHVRDAFVFHEAIVCFLSRAFGVDALNGGVQPAEVISTIGKRDLREQQNAEDDKNYELLLD
jgi:hypothetical protein